MSLSHIVYTWHFKGLQSELWPVCPQFWPALLQLLTVGKEQLTGCFQPCLVPQLPGAPLLSHSSFLWGASVRKVAPGKAAGERKLQAHLPLVIPFVFWFFQHCPPRCTMPAGEDHSWWPSCDTPGDMPALVSIADSLDCPFTALPLAAFLNVLHWLLFLPFSQVIYHKCYTFTCSEFHDWLLYYKSHPVVSCCHF